MSGQVARARANYGLPRTGRGPECQCAALGLHTLPLGMHTAVEVGAEKVVEGMQVLGLRASLQLPVGTVVLASNRSQGSLVAVPGACIPEELDTGGCGDTARCRKEGLIVL